MTSRYRRILTALANHDNLHVQYKMSGAVIEHKAIGRVTFAELSDLLDSGLIQKVPMLDEYEISEKGRQAFGASLTICGIDPGTKGGIAFIYPNATAEGFPLPYDGNALNVIELCDLFEGVSRIYVEKPMILRGQGGAMTTGSNYGRILATATLSHIPLREVSPSTWKSKLLGKTENKGAAIALAKQLFPTVELVQPGCRTEHDGVAEALLIAEWGRRHG